PRRREAARRPRRADRPPRRGLRAAGPRRGRRDASCGARRPRRRPPRRARRAGRRRRRGQRTIARRGHGGSPMSAPDRPDVLRRAITLLDVDRRRVVSAVLLGSLALGSAVALAAVSAWLIARASQMPPVLTLSVATVS